MAGVRTTLTTVLAMNNSKFKRGIDGSKKSLTGLQKQIVSMKGMIAGAFAVTAITTFTRSSIQALDFQRKAQAKVAQAIKTTGGVAGFAAIELENLAKSLQKVTLFGDEDILSNVTAQLLTFTNIAGKEFKRTQQIVLDVSTVIGQDLKSTAIQLGKALNDPVANLGALGRSGIQFSKDQKVLIKSLWEVGQQAEAQGIILAELERQYGGQAKAAADVDVSLTQLKNRFGDFKEGVAGLIISVIKAEGAFKDLWVATTSHEIGFLDRVLGLFSPAKAAEILAVAAAFKEFSEAMPGGAAGFDFPDRVLDDDVIVIKTLEERFKAWIKINDAIRKRIELQEELTEAIRESQQAHIDGILEANKKRTGEAPTFFFGEDEVFEGGEAHDTLLDTIEKSRLKLIETKETAKQLGDQIGMSLVNQFDKLGEAIGKFASGAEDSFRGLGDAIMQNLGNILIMMGAQTGNLGLVLAGAAIQLGGGILRGLGSDAGGGRGFSSFEGGQVNFRISGENLTGVLERHEIKTNRFS